MAAEASTPTEVATSGRKGRRSWFTPGKPILLEFAHENPQPKKKKEQEDTHDEEIEILTLTHFTKPPRIDFGTLRINKSRTRKLLIQNPHEYEQEVFVEKFPFAKNFTIDLTEFVVDAHDEVILRLTWNPLEAGNAREMILFHVQNAYRLQAIMFGKSEEPPKPKKKSLWERAKKPFGVLQTKNRNVQNIDPRRTTYDKKEPAPRLTNVPTVRSGVSQKAGMRPPNTLRQKNVRVEKENTPPRMTRGNKENRAPASPAHLRRTTTYTKVTSPRKDRVQKVPMSPPIREERENEEPAKREYEQDSLMMSPEPEPLQLDDLASSQNYHITTSVDGELIETEVIVMQEMHQQESIIMETHVDVEVIEEEFLYDGVTGERVKLGETVSRHQFGNDVREFNTRVVQTVDVERRSEVYMQDERPLRKQTVPPTRQQARSQQQKSPNTLLGQHVSHEEMMKELDAAQSRLEEQMVASTPVTTGKRRSFDAMTARKLPSPVISSNLESAVKTGGYFPSPLDLPDDSRNRVAAIHQWQINSRKELFGGQQQSDEAASHHAVGGSSPDILSGTPGRSRHGSGQYFEPITSPEANRRFSTLTVTKAKPDLPHANGDFQSVLHVPKKELFAKPLSPDQRRISNVTVTKSSPTVAHLLHSPDADGFRPIISPDARRISNITVTKLSPEFLKPLSPDLRRISNVTVTKKEPSFLSILDTPGDDSIFKQVKSPDPRRISNATVTISSPSMSHLLLSPPQEEQCELEDGVLGHHDDLLNSPAPSFTHGNVPSVPACQFSPEASTHPRSVSNMTAAELETSDMPQMMRSRRAMERIGSLASTVSKTSSQSSVGPGLSPSDLLSHPADAHDDVFHQAKTVNPVSKADRADISLSTSQLLMTPDSDKGLYRNKAGRNAIKQSVSLSDLLESPQSEEDVDSAAKYTDCADGNPACQLFSSDSAELHDDRTEKQAVTLHETRNTAVTNFGLTYVRPLEEVVTNQITDADNLSPHPSLTLPLVTVTPVQQRRPPHAVFSPEGHTDDILQEEDLNVSGHAAFSSEPVNGSARKRRSIGKARDTPSKVYSLKRSSKGKRRHRRSVTQTLDSSICSPDDLPQAETSLRVDPDSLVPAVDGPLERLKKSPAKYSGIYLQSAEENAAAPSPQRKSTASTELKNHSPPKRRSGSLSRVPKKNSPKNSVKLSRYAPVKVGLGVKSPQCSSGESNKRLSTGRQKSESFFNRLSQPKRVASSKEPTKKVVQKEMSQTAGPVMTGAERPKGFTRTMELRRQAALTTMKKTDKQASSLRPKSNAPVVKKPKLSASLGSVKGLAQSKLTLIKPKTTQTALPKHPLAFAAKNMYYDERWMEKQERGFVRWLNFVLTPPDVYTDAKTQKVDVGALSLSLQKTTYLAPSKEDLSLRAYTAQRRLNRLRRSACMLFTSADMAKLIRKLETEIEAGRIAVRKDRKLHADLGIKQNLLDMMLSYNPLWLRIGLEVIFGEMIFVQSNSDLIGLSRFILTRLLSNPDISQKFAHPTVPHLYKPGFDEAMAQFILKKFLLLVAFLDMAKESRLIEHDPCLFCKDSNFKSSRDMLLTFSRDYLSGEGDLTKHLNYLGYQVKHVQTALDEYDYAVENLAKDLRDGVRMVRVCELLMSDWSLSCEVRVPAISRLQKIHNVSVSFRVLAQKGVELQTIEGGKIDTRDVVDGHREKTLQMLWRVIFNFQVEMMLNEKQLKEEIALLQNHLRLRTQIAAVIDDNLEVLGLPRDRRQSTEPDVYFTSLRLSLLLKWCRAVCAYYDVKVENFTVSFSDGRVLCYLVHHYHPSLLPRTSIRQETTQTFISQDASPNNSLDADDSFSYNWTTTFSPTTGKPGVYEELLANERDNFKLLYEKVSELGAIPMMVRSTDMSNTIPDEKVVITYVSYLCMRLLDIRQESRAARVIQAAWRTYWLRKNQGSVQQRHDAARVIQVAVRSYLQRRREQRISSVVVRLQAFCRGYLVRRQVKIIIVQRQHAKENDAARKIQMIFRRFLLRRRAVKVHAARKIQAAYQAWRLRRRFIQIRGAVTILQSHVRRWRAERQYQTRRAAACSIQQWLRATWLAHYERDEYIRSKKAVICLQKNLRMHLCRQRFTRICEAVINMQSAMRMWNVMRSYKRTRLAAVTLQRRWRAHQLGKRERVRFLQIKAACVIIQKHYWLWRTSCIKQEIDAATCIQAAYRGYCARKIYRQERSARTIQAMFRMHLARQQCRKKYEAILSIQRMVRCMQERQRYCRMREAAMIIQRYYRAVQLGRLQREQYVKLHSSALVLQKVWRGHVVRRHVRQYCAARTIQNAVRCYQARNRYQCLRSSAVLIQSLYRCHRQRSAYVRLRHAAITLQTYYRAHSLKRHQSCQYQEMRSAAVTLQSAFRQFRQRQQYLKLRCATVLIQAAWRRTHERRHFIQSRNATIILQAAWRRKMAQRKYAQLRDATIKVQSYWRSRSARVMYSRLRNATILVQALWRMKIEERKFAQLKNAAVVLQAAWRKRKAHAEYNQLRCAVVVIQAVWRKKLLQTKYNQLRCAAVRVQSVWRMHCARHRFIEIREATVVLQAAWKCRSAVNRYRERRDATIVLQRWFRSCRLSRHDQSDYARMKQAAIRIQSAWRRHAAEKRLVRVRAATLILQTVIRRTQAQQKYAVTKTSVVTIQRWYRSLIATRTQRDAYQRQRKSALVIQSAWRGHTKHREYQKVRKACIVLQSNVRRYHACTHYQRMRTSITVIQSSYRCYAQRKTYVTLRRAALTLQTHYRAHCLRNNCRSEFVKLRSAAVCLQANFRARRERLQYLAFRSAALNIQTAWRRTIALRRYQDQKDAAIQIQRWYRNCHVTRQVHRQYCKMRQSVICLQSLWRSLVVHRMYTRQKAAAIIVQSHVRRFLTEHHYLKMKSSTVTIQRWYRSILEGRSRREVYRQRRCAAITIQSCWRRYAAQQHYRTVMWSVVTIQAWTRMHLVRRDFNQTRQSVITIQRWYHASSQSRAQRQSYLHQCASVIKLQAAWRSYRQRNLYLTSRKAAIVIQSHVRRFQVYRSYRSQLHAAKVIQSWFRFISHKRRTEAQRIVEAHSAVAIQSSVRRYLVRRNYLRMRAATISIQSTVKMLICRRHYQAMKAAAVSIQQRWRAEITARCHRTVFIQQRHAATTITAAWRGHVQRVAYLKMKASVICLQAHVRSHQQHDRYQKMREAAVTIQCYLRAARQARTQRCVYLQEKRSVIRIQAVFRCFQARQKYLLQKQSSVIIQSAFRGYLVRRQMRREGEAASCIQRWFRKLLVYHIRRGACIVLQTAVRGWIARQSFIKQRSASVTIQKWYRGHLDRKLAMRRFAAILVLQSQLCASLLARRQRAEYKNMRGAAICLQSAYRGMCERRKFHYCQQCIIRIQACYRRHLAQKQYHHTRQQIILVQSLVRMHLCRASYLRVRGATCTLQCHVRSYQLGCTERRKYLAFKEGIVKLQALVRARQTRKQFLIKKNAAIILQRQVRSVRIMKTTRISYRETRKSVIVVQSVIRRWLVQRRVKRSRAAVKIQSFFRMILVICSLQRSSEAAVCLQSYWRRYVARREAQRRQAAIHMLQSHFRRYLVMRQVRHQFVAKREAAVVIQSYCRGLICRRRVQRIRAVICIQSAVRSYLQRRTFKRQIQNIVHLQSVIRGWMSRRYYAVVLRRQRSAVCIQRAFRRYQVQKQIKVYRQQRSIVIQKFSVKVQRHLAVVKCQRIVRRYLMVRRAKHQIHAILKIQRWMRAKLERLQYLRLLHTTRVIQTRFRQHQVRRHHAASTIQTVVRRWLIKRREVHTHESATKIQALWRGYRTRRAIKDKRLHEARRRCQAATESATDDKRLGNRTSSALDCLLKYRQLSYILSTVMHLEVSTRLSPRCCERMAEVNAVDVIYRLIRSCNRSLPHMEIITYSIAILLNLAKYDKTTYAVYTEDSVETLLDLLQIYRGKGAIFTKACTLIGIMGYDPHRRKEIVGIPKLVSKMQSLYTLTQRQHKLEEKRNITKTKMAARNLGASILVGGTPRKQMQKIRPEWVLRRNSVREIEDPMAAITFVLNILHIAPK